MALIGDLGDYSPGRDKALSEFHLALWDIVSARKLDIGVMTKPLSFCTNPAEISGLLHRGDIVAFSNAKREGEEIFLYRKEGVIYRGIVLSWTAYGYSSSINRPMTYDYILQIWAYSNLAIN